MTPRKLTYVFPVGNTTDICAVQSLTAAGSLVLNGNLVNPVTNEVSFISRRYSRSVSITAGAVSLASMTFNVTGTQNGVTFTGPDIQGPTAGNTTYGTLVYDTITSITATGVPLANSTVSVGTGYFGFFPIIAMNLWPPVIDYTLNITNIGATTSVINIYGSIANIVNNGKTIINNLTANNPTTFPITVDHASPLVISTASSLPVYPYYIVQIGKATTVVANTFAIQLGFMQI